MLRKCKCSFKVITSLLQAPAAGTSRELIVVKITKKQAGFMTHIKDLFAHNIYALPPVFAAQAAWTFQSVEHHHSLWRAAKNNNNTNNKKPLCAEATVQDEEWTVCPQRVRR